MVKKGLFDVIFPEYPTNGKGNQIKILSTEYDLDKIQIIKMKVTNYLGKEKDISLQKTSNDNNYFTYDTSSNEIVFKVFYLTGDLIELLQLESSDESFEFTDKTYKFGFNFPIVFNCSPVIKLNQKYSCELILAKWGVDYYDFTTINQIIMQLPDGSTTKNYCNPQDMCDYKITVNNKEKGTIRIIAEEEGYYFFLSITSNNNRINQNYNSNKNYAPKFSKDANSLIEFNLIQFISTQSDSLASNFTFNKDEDFLFINDELIEQCTPADSLEHLTCHISITSIGTPEVKAIKLLRNNIYYYQTDLNIITYESSKTCQNDEDNDSIQITLTSSTDDLLQGYSMCFNNKENITAIGTEISSKQYSYEFRNSLLENGVYNSIGLIKDNINYQLIANNIFTYISNEIIEISGNLFRNKNAQSIIFIFKNEIDSISSIELKDENSNKLDPQEECSKDLSTKSITCIYDVNERAPDLYEVSFISTCRDREFINKKKIINIYDVIFNLQSEFSSINSEIFFTIEPETQNQITKVKLVNIEDNSEIESQSFSLLNETYGKFLVREKIGTYIIKFELNSILYQASSSLLIYKNQLSLISSQLVLPTGDTVISTIKVQMSDPILTAQIDYITFDGSYIQDTNYINSDNAITINLPLPQPFTSVNDHIISIKDKTKNEIDTYIIKVIEASKIIFLKLCLFKIPLLKN